MLNAHGQQWNVKGSQSLKIKYDDQYPLQLLHTDSQYVIITKGNENFTLKEIEIFTKEFRSIRKIKVNSTTSEKVDHLVWTGEFFILLWEKKVNNKRSLSFQTVALNGRTSNKQPIAVIDNGWSSYVRQHHVDVLNSPDQGLFGFVVKDVVSKSFQGKNAEFHEVTAVFDTKGKLLDKQQNKYNKYSLLDAYHFLTNDSTLIKWTENFPKNEFIISQRNIVEKTKQNSKVQFPLPSTVKLTAYHLEYNPIFKSFDLFANTKSHDSILGQNGLLFVKFQSESFQVNGQWYQPYDSLMVAKMSQAYNFSEGNVVYKDMSFGKNFAIRKAVGLADGSWYVIQEYFPRHLPEFIKSENNIITTSPTRLQKNVDEKYHTPLHQSDAIISHIDKDGKILWSKRVPKPQHGLGHQWGSIESIVQNDNLYLLYNIEAKEKSIVKKLDQHHVVLSHLRPYVIKIQPDGEWRKLKPHNRIEKDYVFYPQFSNSYSRNDEGYIFLQKNNSLSPSEGRLAKFVIEQ